MHENDIFGNKWEIDESGFAFFKEDGLTCRSEPIQHQKMNQLIKKPKTVPDISRKPQTVGELYEHFQSKIENDDFSRENSISKLQHIQYELDQQVKTEIKLEHAGPNDEEEQLIPQNNRKVTQLVTIRPPDRPRDVFRIKLDFVQPPPRKRRPELKKQSFDHEDVWNPLRQLCCKMSSERIQISNMVALPPQKHRLNPPKIYKPLQPLKKKLYRPAVPRLFRSGYDEYLQRRRKNGIGSEVDLGVWNVDEVLEECYKRDLIPLATYNQFVNTNGHLQIRRFLQAWQGAQLESFDFKRTNFTLFDHRRLTELLMHCYPDCYTRDSIESLHSDVKEFIAATYRLNCDDYAESYLLLDEISECSWWSDLKARLQVSPEHSSYFKLKEGINKPPLPANMQQDKHSKSEYIRDMLGPIPIQDSQAELEKILSMKHKKDKGQSHLDDAATSYRHNDEDQEFEESHDRTEISSQQSDQGNKDLSAQEWDLYEGQ